MPFDPDSEFFLSEICEAPVNPNTLGNRDHALLSPIDDASSRESGSSADEANRSERENLIRAARDIINGDTAGVVRRVNRANTQRLPTPTTLVEISSPLVPGPLFPFPSTPPLGAHSQS